MIAWLVVSALAGPPQGANDGCVVGVPAVHAPAITAVFAGMPERVVIAPMASVGTTIDANVEILLAWDALALARAASGATAAFADAVPVLPWAVELGVAIAVGTVTDAGGTIDWEELALHPALHDRLGILAPEIDGSPWLGAMESAQRHGDRDDHVIALWTTLDARCGRLLDSEDALRTGLSGGSLAAAIAPRSRLGRTVADSGGRLQLASLRSGDRAPVGFLVANRAGVSAQRVAVRLRENALQQEIAAALGLSPAGVGTSGEDRRRLVGLWGRFETEVRGRGRSVEAVADRLDLVFGIVFVVIALIVWRSTRGKDAAVG